MDNHNMVLLQTEGFCRGSDVFPSEGLLQDVLGEVRPPRSLMLDGIYRLGGSRGPGGSGL